MPGAIAVAALSAAFCNKFALIAEVNQRIKVFIGTQNNAAAASAVAAVRAALFYKFSLRKLLMPSPPAPAST